MDIRKIDLAKLNSMTKYPSIPTFHMIGEKGRLMAQCLPLPLSRIIATEKIDGTNARIISPPRAWDGPAWILGSREELLCAEGDLIGDPALGIVKAMRAFADHAGTNRAPNRLNVIYGEVYGGKVTANSKHYTSAGRTGFRVFDIMTISEDDAMRMLANYQPSQIASWRDGGGQRFTTEESIQTVMGAWGWELTPRIAPAYSLPSDLAGAHKWLRDILPGKTYSALDGDGGKPEGAVIRTHDRNFIAKLRFEDYERTLR